LVFIRSFLTGVSNDNGSRANRCSSGHVNAITGQRNHCAGGSGIPINKDPYRFLETDNLVNNFFSILEAPSISVHFNDYDVRGNIFGMLQRKVHISPHRWIDFRFDVHYHDFGRLAEGNGRSQHG
jgi:hypothetical protein